MDVKEGTLWEDLYHGIGQDDTPKKTQVHNPIVHVTRQDGTVDAIPLETYLEGVVGSEMPASYQIEALKAQSVAARTFVLQRDLQVDDTIRTQVYHDDAQMHQIWGAQYAKYHTKVKQAIQATSGEVMTYNGALISAVFFSSSCGKTANAEEYWGYKTPYLRSVDSAWDKSMPGYEKTVDISADTLRTALGFAKPIQELGKPVYYASGYVKSITIDRIQFSGKQVRDKLNLRSSSFTITKKDGGFAITTKGFGHGIGMSQEGAQAMALQGNDYKTILHHYYQGIKIERKDV